MKIKLLSYFAAFTLLIIGLNAIAEESRVRLLSDQEYKSLTDDFNKGNDCIFSRSIDSWTVLDKNSLILYAPTKKRPYYVKLNMQAFGLKFVNSIGVYSQFDNRFCPYGGDALFIDGDRYTINAIKSIDEETAKQLITYHKKR